MSKLCGNITCDNVLVAVERGLAHMKCRLADNYFFGACQTPENKEMALALYQESADRNVKEAQFMLGNIYSQGYGVVSVDFKKAYMFYKLAAEQNHPGAFHCLGDFYYYGEIVKANMHEAFKFYQNAAELRFPQAQHKLGNCYYYGHGIAEDKAQALKWHRLAAEQNLPEAEHSMGIYSQFGYGGMEINDAEALNWFKLAADHDLAEAQFTLATAYSKGMLGLERNGVEAFMWCELAADQGHIGAMCEMGDILFNGDHGQNVDKELALKWYGAAAKRGNKRALMMVMIVDYNFYMNGGRMEHETKVFLDWYSLAVNECFPEAQYIMGTFYHHGMCGIMRDEEVALHWYKLAANQGYAPACLAIGHMYDRDEAMASDEEEALKWFCLAARKGLAEGQFELGTYYLFGLGGLSADKMEAIRLFELAAQQGLEDADIALKLLLYNTPEDDDESLKHLSAPERRIADNRCWHVLVSCLLNDNDESWCENMPMELFLFRIAANISFTKMYFDAYEPLLVKKETIGDCRVFVILHSSGDIYFIVVCARGWCLFGAIDSFTWSVQLFIISPWLDTFKYCCQMMKRINGSFRLEYWQVFSVVASPLAIMAFMKNVCNTTNWNADMLGFGKVRHGGPATKKSEIFCQAPQHIICNPIVVASDLQPLSIYYIILCFYCITKIYSETVIKIRTVGN